MLYVVLLTDIQRAPSVAPWWYASATIYFRIVLKSSLVEHQSIIEHLQTGVRIAFSFLRIVVATK